MGDSATNLSGCDHELLRAQLEAALVEADRCDPIVAVYVDTALAMLGERFGFGTRPVAHGAT